MVVVGDTGMSDRSTRLNYYPEGQSLSLRAIKTDSPGTRRRDTSHVQGPEGRWWGSFRLELPSSVLREEWGRRWGV